MYALDTAHGLYKVNIGPTFIKHVSTTWLNSFFKHINVLWIFFLYERIYIFRKIYFNKCAIVVSHISIYAS